MKRLFGTADLEAELFAEEGSQAEEYAAGEYEISDAEAEGMAMLDGLSEEDMADFPALELSLELTDGRILEYEAIGVFVHGEKEYMALHPKSDTEGTVHLMQLLPGENDEIRLLPVEDDQEFAEASEAFYYLLGDAGIGPETRQGESGTAEGYSE